MKTSQSKVSRVTSFSWATRPGESYESNRAKFASKMPMGSRRQFPFGLVKRLPAHTNSQSPFPDCEKKLRLGSLRWYKILEMKMKNLSRRSSRTFIWIYQL